METEKRNETKLVRNESKSDFFAIVQVSVHRWKRIGFSRATAAAAMNEWMNDDDDGHINEWMENGEKNMENCFQIKIKLQKNSKVWLIEENWFLGRNTFHSSNIERSADKRKRDIFRRAFRAMCSFACHCPC